MQPTYFCWVMLLQTASFVGVGTELPLKTVYILPTAPWIVSIFIISTSSVLTVTFTETGLLFLPSVVHLFKKIFIIIIHIGFTIYNLQSSLNRPLYLTEHCCQHSSQSSISLGSVPLLCWLSIYFSNVLYSILTVDSIIVPALKGVDCFFSRKIVSRCDPIRSDGCNYHL